MWNGSRHATAEAKAVGTQLGDRLGVRIIPYDYVATFELRGEVGNLIEDVINISVEGTFIGVAVGYGLEADTVSPVNIITDSGADLKLEDITLADLPPHVLMDGFRSNPSLQRLAFPNTVLDGALPVATANEVGLFQRIQQSKDFNFLFNFIDSGSGRELQNAPIHNIAGLGKTNGERPFRMLAKPLAFLPRSSVRIQVEEKSADVTGRLFIVLHGYKILGAASVPEEHLRILYQRNWERFGPRAASAKLIKKVEQMAIPSARLVPFDYVGTADLIGQKGNIVEVEINVNVEGGFVATSIGYSLAVETAKVDLNFDMPNANGNNNNGNGNGNSNDEPINVGDIKLTQFPSNVLRKGFRIRPEFLRVAFANGRLATLPKSTVLELFEPLNLPENVNFLYSIIDTGTGREWQNEPVHNIAGLGIANGDRPFRNLAWPMHFLPRSTIRLRVEEIFGRGRLFMVFQGYKILSAK